MAVSDELVQNVSAQIERLAAATQKDVEQAQAAYLHNALATNFGLEPTGESRGQDDVLYASEGLGLVGLDLLRRHARDPNLSERAWRELLWSAFRLRRSALYPDSSLTALLETAIDGVLANRQPELRLELARYGLHDSFLTESDGWDEVLQSEISRAVLLLVRKGSGRGDLSAARAIIGHLRELQPEREPSFLGARSGSDGVEMAEVLLRTSRVVALYNVAALVDLTASYLLGDVEAQGRLSADGVKDDIDRFLFGARDVLVAKDPHLRLLTARIAAACRSLVDSSIYSAVMPPQPRALLLDMAQREAERPVLELWYAQRVALQRSLLDPTRSAIVVSMPTSAGKTLLAELAIAQAHNDDPDAVVVYLAPTRALVTQASLTLRRDLADRQLKVRVATPVFDLDPVEAEVLASEFEVLVTTPEKLDLLMREEHPAVKRISLVVVDEAHGLNEPERGARLELLLATLRREKAGTRFLLLSPFASNAAELARWLGGDSGTPIVIDWKPNDRLVGVVQSGHKVRGEDRRPFTFSSLDSVHSDCRPGEAFFLGDVPADVTGAKRWIAEGAASKLAEAKTGGVLLLASSRPKAEDRAKSLASSRDPGLHLSRSVAVVTRFLDAEAGGDHPLSELLRRGVAFHHAGLSSEARYFVERLVEEGAVDIICATTTLAQGVHFPLSAAVIETTHRSINYRGRWRTEPLARWELWNIVGRVGRTLEDRLGLIAFPSRGDADRESIQEYLRDDASVVSSTLLDFVRSLKDEREISFSRSLLQWQPAASAFLQYIVHAIAVADREVSERDLEGLLRASFVFEQAQGEDPEVADALIRIARAYLENLRERKGDALSGFAKLADGTGFSSPSVDAIWAQWRGDHSFDHSVQDWSSESLFPGAGSASDVLTQVVMTLQELPELKLGSEEEGDFSAERVARIAALWVDGIPLANLAAREYGGDLLRCAHHVYGTVTNLLPWGLRAIQRVALTDRPEEEWKDFELAPAMIYHGVRSREAIALRMLSVPRVVAEGLAARWRGAGEIDLADAASWLEERSPEDWSEALPEDSPISGSEIKTLWEVLEGRRDWRDMAS